MLVIFGGLPGTGKTTLARGLAGELGACYVRVDTIEQALLAASPGWPVGEAGYRVAFAMAEDNLRLGRSVVADSVNPLPVTRAAWRDVARRVGAVAVEIEIICSVADEHRQRVEGRTADIPGHRLPSWRDVVSREYAPWSGDRLVIDTAGQSEEQSLAELVSAIARYAARR
jgi:predicted kinase